MKKLNLHEISSEKLMKSEDLLVLRGGSETDKCGVSCSSDANCDPSNLKSQIVISRFK
jgi:hypothetical protein